MNISHTGHTVARIGVVSGTEFLREGGRERGANKEVEIGGKDHLSWRLWDLRREEDCGKCWEMSGERDRIKEMGAWG
jgi:hypothetical protein